MSHNASPHGKHGFCTAIFSSAPTKCNKENMTPSDKTNERHWAVYGTPSSKVRKKNELTNVQSNKQKTNNKNEITQRLVTTSKLTVSSSSKTRCTNKLQKQESVACNSNINTKTPVKLGGNARAPGDKTPINFSTPKTIKTYTPVQNLKVGLLPLNRTPLKRYFSDHSLTQATPDCFNAVQVETPQCQAMETISDETSMYDEESSNLTVGIRIRPLNLKELNDPTITSVTKVDGQNITVEYDSVRHTFVYDHCFTSYANNSTTDHATQETVFKTMVSPLVTNAFEGYNVCLFAYGQTGSGKSYSMMGLEPSQIDLEVNETEAGIIPRFCKEIFTKISNTPLVESTVEISYFEIYNEKIHDLLANTNVGVKRAPLKVREHPVFGPYIVDLSQHSVQSYKDLQTWLKVGNSQRATAATGMNEKSSRSHSIFSIILTRARKDATSKSKSTDQSWRSKINLVDLAGSERLSQTCASGDRLKEGVSINKSLLILGKVIASLAESTNNRKRGFVPYRESVLTWLLKESLGGNSKTAMLGTISPASIHLEETLATLRYACQARAIINRVRINEDPHEKLIRDLKAEVIRLRGVRDGYERQLGMHPRRLVNCMEPVPVQTTEELDEKQKEIDQLKEQLKKTEEQLVHNQRTWLEKLEETEEKKKSELKYLRRCGIAIELDVNEMKKQPCLINLAADPMLSGTLFYLIPPGLVHVGKNSQIETATFGQHLDIVLNGPLVRPLHCTIENKNGQLILSPESNADTYVNGQAVMGKVVLKHGDRLVIGGNHYFKVSNPYDNPESIQVTAKPMDFEFAHQEILKIQEEKLKGELEESKRKAIIELENAKREVEMQLGSQKSIYERKIEMLGSTLEEQKLALEEINRKKQELELEKEFLATELKANNKIRKIQLEETKITLSPYKSNFLQELESILNEKTADVEIALKTNITKDSIYAGGVSLHEMQMLVREATERCREFGLKYEFNQQQIVVDKKLKPCIRVRDRDCMMEIFWEPMRFINWVHKLRDYDIEDSIKELRDVDGDWEPYEDSEMFEDSLNNSRISVNITPVKRSLNESLFQFSLDTSGIDGSFVEQVFDDSAVPKIQGNVNACLIQMELASKTLVKLCQQNENKEINDSIQKSVNEIQALIKNLKSTLNSKNISESNEESSSSNPSINTTVIEKSNTSEILASSNGQNSLWIQNGVVQKTVKFLEKNDGSKK
ncbi:kinesin-like protein KIF14 isoform X2 [Prorops nasuta]|uniref:kinesin-like protein KIF14 isoform X2 n=1 Tax=Prorops nasuta TaxID=863751 RepID=UPI0034CD049B